MQETPSDEPIAPLAEVVHPLSYATPSTLAPGKSVTVGRYASSMEAAMHANRLEEEEIACVVVNANVNNLGIPYSGFSTVDLQVNEEDAKRALDALATHLDDLEPADGEDARPALDDDGQPIKLAEAGRYATVRQLQSAQTALASSRIKAFPPALVKRGDRPAGTGRRFVLRVAEDDVERAQAQLEKMAADDDADDEPRCPKCDSWRVYPVGTFFRGLGAMLGLCPWPEKQIECLACRHRGRPGEFGKGL